MSLKIALELPELIDESVVELHLAHIHHEKDRTGYKSTKATCENCSASVVLPMSRSMMKLRLTGTTQDRRQCSQQRN